MSALEQWRSWRDRRWATVSAPFGVASLERTEWLQPGRANEVPGVPGTWTIDGDEIVGTTPEATVRLSPGQEKEIGSKLVRAFARDGSLALRILSPSSPHLVSLTGIDAFDYDDAWVIEGQLSPAEPDRFVDITAVDGAVSSARLAGTIALETPTGPTTLTVTESRSGGLSAVVADATAESGTYRFRFLEVGTPDESGRVRVDFNRTFLPPCAFSPEYVCPMPLPGNRWGIELRAGERNVTRADG